jgi:DeoR/GlpR family transcriptional regulator of sugar metabolism
VTAVAKTTSSDGETTHGRGLSPAERARRALALIHARGEASVGELAEHFAVSEVTVRNDLSALARQGLVDRVHGGARATSSHQSEPDFDVRVRLQEPEKRAIARAAAELVVHGDVIALDCSTTAYYLALELHNKRELVVVTNGLRVASALANEPGVTVIVAGGVLRPAGMSTVGDLASGFLQELRANKGFFGARGLRHDEGLSELNPEEARTKRELAARCDQVIGIADSTKWGRSALRSFVPPEQLDVVVTDSGSPADAIDALRRDYGVDVITVQVVGADADGSEPSDGKPETGA